MATTRITPLHIGKGRKINTAIQQIIRYVENPEKTDNGRLITSYMCDSRIADAQFLLAKQQYIRKTGRVRGSDDVIAYTIRQSFVPGEITPEEANRLGTELAKRFTKGKHAFVVCTHIDKDHIHNHIVWSAVNLDCTRKFRNFWGSSRAVRKLSDTICIENGYSVIDNPKRCGKSYDKWFGSKPPSHQEILMRAIDDALAKKPDDMETLFALLEDAGFTIRRGKSPSAKATGWGKAVRFNKINTEYSEKELLAVLAGEKEHTPRPRQKEKGQAQSNPERISLLVDIQVKLQAGKGRGYEQWAKVFNLKQMARSWNYLNEHNLQDIDELREKTSAATTKYHDLSDRIKAAESRMKEINELRTQIINYSKTRSVYVAYRKAGYSKKFLAEHEPEILLHKTAKKAFDEMGIKKLPTIKSLGAEYAELVAEKKKLYKEYTAVRQEMRELQTVQANVEKILNLDAQGQDRQPPDHKKNPQEERE